MQESANESSLAAFSSWPIPPLPSPAGWQEGRIRECAERLVPLSALHPRRIVVDPRYHQAGYAGAPREACVRESVARRLHTAAATLPAGWTLAIFDAWRPVAVQQELFARFRATLRGRYPEASEAWLEREAQRYVSRPSQDPVRPSPHLTGGAVDLTLRDASGADLPMGTEFDEFDERSGTRYFEARLERDGTLSREDLAALRHRRILFHALTRVGFTNYPEEWWHFEYGRSQFGPILTLEGWLRDPPPGG